MTCPACGFANPEDARYCGSCGVVLDSACRQCRHPLARGLRYCTACGTAVAEGAETSAAPADEEHVTPGAGGSERRRISVMFADLVDFTALAERLDPEAVRGVQARYFEVARSVVAAHGGTIEKFIGDAVMAVWGAPVAHEDDPDRAVRAALALVDGVRRLGGVAANRALDARAAVTTGEAAVTIGAIGQGMVAGDLVNTAARLQGAAPSGGVLVDAATRGLAHQAARYEAAGEVELKGRDAPVLAHLACAVVGVRPVRQGGTHSGTFVDRTRELRELIGLFEGVVETGHSRLVTITGIAGIGKSRLAWELREHLDTQPADVAWHDGRAPAYGDEVTFAALAEMVRRRARIPDDAAPEIARRQLATLLDELVRDDDERRWMEPRVTVLLEPHATGTFDRDELFAAWRRFFERVSDHAPAVLVFEDLHWADPGLLDFVEHLGAWTRDHPILVLALARPELVDRRPSWGSTTTHYTAIHLERLPDAAMVELLHSRAPDLDDVTVQRVLGPAGGVPLYAVEVARIAAGDRDGDAPNADDRRASARPGPEVSVPDSLHGLIVARIDGLPATERHVLRSAAVLGRRFTVDGLAAVAEMPAPAVRDAIDELARRELLSVDEHPGSPRFGEIAFIQDLVREVAYGTISHAERRALHLAAARHLEVRPEDEVAESLASHLIEAHRLQPEHPDAHRIARRAVAALRRAAHNALHIHLPHRALGHLEHALRLTDKPEQRAVVLGETATAARAAGRLDLAETHLRELIVIHEGAGRRRDVARGRAHLASVLLMAQRNEPAIAELESAVRANRHIEADPSGVEIAAQLARARMLVGDDRAGLDWAERALRAAERHGLDGLATDVLVTRGTVRFRLGDVEGGMADLRRAIDTAAERGLLTTELRARNNLAWLLVADDPRTTLETAREAVELAASMGVGDLTYQLAEVATAVAVDTGEWAWALDIIEEVGRGVVPIANRANLASTAGIIRVLRGEPQPLAAITALGPLPPDMDRQVVAGLEYARAWERLVRGEFDEACELARRAATASLAEERHQHLALAARAALWMGAFDEVERLADEMRRIPVRGRAVETERRSLLVALAATRDGSSGAADLRRVAGEWESLALPLQEALSGLDAVMVLGDEPWPETSVRLTQLGAGGLERIIEQAPMAAGRAGPRRPAGSPPPSDDTARPTGGARLRRPGPAPRRRRG